MGKLHSVPIEPMKQQISMKTTKAYGDPYNNSRQNAKILMPSVQTPDADDSCTVFEGKEKSLEDEISNLRKTIESLQSENRRLQSERSNWFWEFEAIRSELVQSQRQLRDSPSASRNVISREDLVVPFPTSPLCKTPNEKYLSGPKPGKSSNSVDFHVIPPSPAQSTKPQFFTFSEDHVAIYNASASDNSLPQTTSLNPTIKTDKCGCIPVTQRSKSFIRGLIIVADQQLMPYKEKFAKKTLPELTRLMESAGLIFLLNEFTVDYATQIERQRTAGTFVILSFLHSIDYTWICDVYSKRSKLCDHCGQPEETGIIQTGIFCIPDSSQSDTTNLLADARSQLFSLSQDNWLDSVHQSCLDAFKSSFGECASIERVIDLLESEENSGRILEAEELFRGNLDSCFGQAYQDSVLEDLLRRTSECDRKSFEPYMEQIRSFVEPNLIYPKVLLIGEQAETLSVMLANFIRYLHLSADSFVVLHHFAISNCSVTCDSAYILRRFCQHMYRLSGTVTKIPIEPQKLRIHFCNLLERQILLQNDGMVILIDQFDRITDYQEFLKWLVEFLPPKVALVMTTNDQSNKLMSTGYFQHKIQVMITKPLFDPVKLANLDKVIKIVSMADGCLTALDLLQLLTDINSRDFVEFVEMGFVLNYGGLLSLPPYVNEAANNDDNICQTLLNFWSTSERRYSLRATLGRLALLSKWDKISWFRTLTETETFFTLTSYGLSDMLFRQLQSCQLCIPDAMKIYFDVSDSVKGVYSIDSCLKTVTLGSIASHYDLPVSWSVRCYQRALEIFLISANPHHPFVALLHDYLASSFFTCGRLSLSDSYFKRALRHLQKSLGVSHPRVIEILESLYHSYQCQNKLAAAEFVQQQIHNRNASRSDCPFAVNRKMKFRSLPVVLEDLSSSHNSSTH